MINIGDVIDNRYTIVEKIGAGGMADVFEANDFIANRCVAIKILKDEFINDKDRVKKFEEEIKISSSMSHPNIVRVFNSGVFLDKPYIVLEYFKEQTLSNKLDFLAKFSYVEAVDIILQVLDALSYTHKHSLIHRDIKPQNIFYLSNGTIKLGDFGIATNEKTVDGKIMGSVYYLAPEVCEGRPFSIRSDIYALGITFFQLLTGKLPFDSPVTEIVIAEQRAKKMPTPSHIVRSIPKELDEIIFKATEKNIGERYIDADAFKADLLAFKQGTYKKENIFRKLFKKL